MNVQNALRRITPRRGAISVEVVIFMASVVVFALLFYLLAQKSFVQLYQIIAIHNGSPFI